ncbi:alpha/beta hydrolase [Williamsia sp. Leaf354]|uniref:alpha/beta hydrolase n=1 Tax=Williamsia sp. Leaf354 TaxID=1736349 RepID=UPI0006F62A52|nr:alpha/beta fold hydrolase [Williamsia sp. Leaf354]KQR98456.1 alpha/beta hydrolase [Williamsia sp. Leaf354]
MTFTRTDVGFSSAGERCAGWLYRPQADDNASGPVPIVVLGHGLGAVKEMRLDAFAERFVAAGYAALVFDYRHFGDSEGTPRQLLDIGKQRADWHAAIAHARGLDGIDPDRVALFGTSFGGGHVLAVAAQDPRVAAVISQCPFTSGLASALTLGVGPSVRVTALGLRDAVAHLTRRSRVMVPLAGRPGEAALMNAHDALGGYLGIVPEGEDDFANAVAATIGLQIPMQRPGKYAADIEVPVLFGVCEKDTVAPAGPTLRFAAKAPKGVIKRYPVGHFDIYVGEPFEVAVTDYVEFLGQAVGH